MKVIDVRLASGEGYPILIGEKLLGRKELIAEHLTGRQCMIVTNDTVAALYADTLRNALAGHEVHVAVIPDGESFKTLATAETVLEAMLKVPCDRSVTVIALGGGVVGDLAGFVSACYQRGVSYIQVPTTLLAQVDSSVGGKTAVNHRLGKNMIGAFHQPQCVIADIATLETLSQRELSAGLAEVVKYGLVRDREFFDWLESNVDALVARDGEALAYAVERSCHNKAQVVRADEREHGIRAILNFGHTFGHAMETGLGHGAWLHGEAVAAGMVMAAGLSRELGWLGPDDVDRIERLLTRCGLPTRGPGELGVERTLELMKVDKKVVSGRIRFVCLRSIGHAEVVSEYPQEALHKVIMEYSGT